MEGISKLQHARALRRMLWTSALGGMYGPLGTFGSTIYTGLALYIGLSASQIAFLSTITAAAGTAYLVSHLITSRVRRQKAYIIASGVVEVVLSCLPPLVPLVVSGSGARFAALGSIVLIATLLANIKGPLHTSWQTLFLPDDIRPRFMSRQSILSTVTGMAIGFAAGQFVDRTGRGYASFAIPYLLAAFVGIAIYLVQLGMPFPAALQGEERLPIGRSLLAPLASRPFRWFLLFNLSLSFGDNIFGPFGGVFVLQEIKETYSYIALIGIICSPIAIASLWFGGIIVERFGGKPIIRLALGFRVIYDGMMLFLTNGNYPWLHTMSTVLATIACPALSIAAMTMMYSVIPATSERSSFVATWSIAHSALAIGVTALVAAIASRISGFSVAVAGLSFSYLKLFLVAKILLIGVSMVLLRRVAAGRHQERLTLGQLFVGNPISFAYHSALLGMARSGTQRAKAVRSLGQSRSPLAVPTLVKAMEDSDPDVRTQAIHGLGDSGSQEAVAPLTQRLADARSELRAEAASSLGRIRDPGGIEPLAKALADPDPRVRMSAIRALADIGGEQALGLLYEAFLVNTDSILLPTFVDSLSRLGDLRVIGPALRGMREFAAPVVRLQLLNAACRALGAGNEFYTLLSLDELSLVQRLYRMQRLKRRFLPRLPPIKRFLALDCLETLAECLEKGSFRAMSDAALILAEIMRGASGHPTVEALRLFNELSHEGITERPEVFTLVVLERVFAGDG